MQWNQLWECQNLDLIMKSKVKKITCADIGQWRDDHPLNKCDTADGEYMRLFEGKRNPEKRTNYD